MAPNPITATHRVIFRYTVDGFQHKLQKYAEAIPSADPTGYDLIGQNGLGTVGFSNVADAIATVLAPFYNAAETTFNACELWVRSGTQFFFVVSTIPTVVPTALVAQVKGYQYAINGKNSAGQNLNTFLYETPLVVPTKVSSFAALPAADKALVDFFYNPGGTAAADSAWNWSQARDIWKVDRWLSVVIDTNEFLRRKRGIK